MNFFSIFQFVEKNSKILDYQHKKVAFLHYLYTVGSLFFCCRAVFAYYFLQICHTNKYFAYDQALGQLHKLGGRRTKSRGQNLASQNLAKKSRDPKSRRSKISQPKISQAQNLAGPKSRRSKISHLLIFL